MNIFDIIIAGAVVLAVGLAIAQIIKNQKNGKSCSCNCRGCPHSCKKEV
ncbi:MAG: FeoB-associated Cys-rich membrane protein [Oscillospiraceae bacterium]|nr:FeoB-associated Cys-rich membrane protein [Oscillospiraceae bacterium]